MFVEDCIFCKISCGSSPCYKVWENEKYLAFLFIYPNTRGLTVVIPKSHQSSYIFDQTDSNITDIMLASKKVAKILVVKFETVGRVGVVFEGYGVDHLHTKLFPLHDTKGSWREIKSEMKTIFHSYPGYISTHDVSRISDEELKDIASFLRGE
jgi:histidine triad (HIT) family protein